MVVAIIKIIWDVSFCMIQINESIVAKTTITVPANGGVVEAVSTIETVPYWTRSRKRSGENCFRLQNLTIRLVD